MRKAYYLQYKMLQYGKCQIAGIFFIKYHAEEAAKINNEKHPANPVVVETMELNKLQLGYHTALHL